MAGAATAREQNSADSGSGAKQSIIIRERFSVLGFSRPTGFCFTEIKCPFQLDVRRDSESAAIFENLAVQMIDELNPPVDFIIFLASNNVVISLSVTVIRLPALPLKL